MGWVVSATSRLLYPRGMGRYPLYRRLGGPQVRSGRVRKISFPRPQRAGIPTTLFRSKQHKLNTIKLEAKSGYSWTTQVYSLTATPPGSVEQFTVQAAMSSSKSKTCSTISRNKPADLICSWYDFTGWAIAPKFCSNSLRFDLHAS